VSRRPAFDDAALLAALGPRAPLSSTREGRVELLGRAASALLAGELPDPEARTFLAAGIAAWLDQGGALTRTFWKVDPVRGSKLTPAAIWRRRSSR
jgi:hypothetical protein